MLSHQRCCKVRHLVSCLGEHLVVTALNHGIPVAMGYLNGFWPKKMTRCRFDMSAQPVFYEIRLPQAIPNIAGLAFVSEQVCCIKKKK